MARAIPARGGSMWAVAGPASDGVNPFIATGNTLGASVWSGGESIIRFQPGSVFSSLNDDYWTPMNWIALDNGDIDPGRSGALLANVAGVTPSQLVVSLGKDGKANLFNRTNLGGASVPVARAHVSHSEITSPGAPLPR